MSNYRRRLLLANQTEENLYLYGNSVQDGTPTPDAPIDIMSVENPTIKVTGKNLIPFPYYSITKEVNGVTFTVNEDGTVIVNGTVSSVTQFNLYMGGDLLLPNVKYTLSGGDGNGSATTYDLRISDSKTTAYTCATNKTVSFSYADTSKIVIAIMVRSGAVLNNVVFKPMLNKGTEALPYEPYEEQFITIDKTTPFGKNLFKTTNYEKGTLNSTTGNMTANTAVRTYCLTTDYIYLKSGAYVLSNKTGANLRFICFYNANKEFKSATWTNRVKTFKFTVTEDCYVRIDVERDANVAIDNFDTFLTEYEFMINEGMNAFAFEPYIPPITSMRGIGDYKDKIYTKDGKVWFEQRSGYCETDANTTLHKNSTNGNVIQAYTATGFVDDSYSALGVETTKAANNPGLSTHFVYSHKAYARGQVDVILCSGTRLWFVSDNFENIDKWNTWIKENKVSIVYPLKNPIITEITGPLAEKILAIDKTKNIYFISENGIQGETEVIEE